MDRSIDLIELRNITRFYEKDGKKTVGVKDVSFKIKKGRTIGSIFNGPWPLYYCTLKQGQGIES